MKVFRDIFGAVLIGIFLGVFVSTISYYYEHKEGGWKQTMLAVLNSFDEISEAYSSINQEDLYTDIQDYEIDDKVLEAFERVEARDVGPLSNGVLKSDSIMGKSENHDILAMEGIDGNIEEGSPYSGILRFHVRANSDSNEDQELKMAVKDDVVCLLKPLLEDCRNVKETRKVIVKNLQNIYITAVDTIIEQGYDYNVKVYLTEEEFPVKTYGDLTFPAGKYQALRIDIGEAKGQNWWCVMYPPLCFVDESTVVVSEDGKEKLKESLTLEEYKNLFAGFNNEDEGKVTIKGESWLYHLIKNK